MQATQKERIEQQPSETGTDRNGGVFKQIDCCQGLPDQIKYIVPSNEDDRIPVLEGSRMHILSDVSRKDG